MGPILKVLEKMQIILEICLIVIIAVPKMIQKLTWKIKRRDQKPSTKQKRKREINNDK